jgi:hypothetical protein
MAKKKQAMRFVWPLAVLVILVGLILLLIDPLGWRKPDAEEVKAQDPERFTLCSLTADDITAIEIAKPAEEPFTLVKDGANWFVEQSGQRYRAEKQRVDSFLQDLPGLGTDSLATDKADKHAEFEVDDAHGILLKVYTGSEQVACDLIVGKGAPGYQSAFVRKPGEDKVYRATKNLKSLVGFALSSFRGKELWPFDPAGANAITVAKAGAGEPAAFTRQTGGFWQNAGGGNGNQNALNELLNAFAKLRVNNFVDDLTGVDTGLPEAPAPTISVTAPEGTFSLELGRLDPEQGQYYVRDQDGHVSLVGEASLKFLLDADVANLKMEQLPDAAPASADAGAEPAGGAPAMPPLGAPGAQPPAAPPAGGK